MNVLNVVRGRFAVILIQTKELGTSALIAATNGHMRTVLSWQRLKAGYDFLR